MVSNLILPNNPAKVSLLIEQVKMQSCNKLSKAAH